MASDILNQLLRLNLIASAAVILILLLRKPLRRLIGARATYALWLIAPLAAVASLLPKPPVPVPLAAGLPEMTFHFAAVPAAVAAPAPIDWSGPMLGLWLAGAGLALGVIAWKHGRFVSSLGRLVRRGDGALTAQISVGPAVLGTLRPRIIVPNDFESRFEPAEQTVVLAHEACHLKAGDAQINAFVVLCQCLCWFNPLVHIAAFHVRLDQELACDAAVMARYPEARRSYAQAMLKTQLAPASLPLGCYWPARSAHPLKERLAMLMLTPPGRRRRLAGAAAIALIAAASGYAAWAAAPATSSPVFRQPTLAERADMDARVAALAGKPTLTERAAAGAPLTDEEREAVTAANTWLDMRLGELRKDAAKARAQANTLALSRPNSQTALEAERAAEASAQILQVFVDRRAQTRVAAAAPAQPPAPARTPRRQDAPASDDICLSNACSTPAGIATAPTGPNGALVGPGSVPNSFAARFNANAPVLVRGKVTEVRRNGAELALMVTLNDGKTFRVIGGAPDRFPDEMYRTLQGSEVSVRGYQSWDTSCSDGCEMNGRDIIFADGRKVFVGVSGAGAPADGTDPSESRAGRIGN